MAYLTTLASVPEERVRAFQRSLRAPLRATKITTCSHLIAYWVDEQPLGTILGEAIDGGDVLHERLWHPLRPPVVHAAAAVRDLNARLQPEWERVLRERRPLAEDDWIAVQIGRLLDILAHAGERDESLVSMLERPVDFGRARRVRLPDLGRGSWIRRWLMR